jgi:hypothetical protein
VLDRASTFADPVIVTWLKRDLVPVAIDQAYQRRQKDAEGDFYRKIAGQGPRNDFNGTTQGLYVCTADGRFLGFSNHRDPLRIRRMIIDALKGFRPPEAKPLKNLKPDPRFNPEPPEGGLVVRVRAKVLGGYEETDNRWQQIFHNALSRDNLWITRGEHQALVRGEVPKSLQKRIARFHLVDNTRGEPPMWREKEIRKVDITLKDGRLTGTVHLETASGDRGYQADLYGVVETKDGRVVRLDMVAKGQFWGEGRFTRRGPKGKFPLAVSFTLADGSDVADRIPPQGSRGWVPGYLR